jgi:hypothetical protein
LSDIFFAVIEPKSQGNFFLHKMRPTPKKYRGEITPTLVALSRNLSHKTNLGKFW